MNSMNRMNRMSVSEEIQRMFDHAAAMALPRHAAQFEKGTVAEAFHAQDILRAAVTWHQKNEDVALPTPLLAMLVAARQCC